MAPINDQRLPYVKPAIQRLSLSSTGKLAGRYLSMTTCHDLDGYSIKELVSRFGTPLYVVSEATLRNRFKALKKAFLNRYENTTIAYSYKTNYLSAICATLHQEGAYAEVVSGFEYDIAKSLGVPGEKIIFNGPYKKPEEIFRAFKEGALVNLDSFEEIHIARKAAEKLGRRAKVGIRLSMQLNYPLWDKFGFSLELGHAFEACKVIMEDQYLELTGLHSHVGTYIIDLSIYRRLVENLIAFASRVMFNLGAEIRFLDVGGGFASKNTLHSQLMPGDTVVPTPEQYAETVCSELRRGLTHFKRPPYLILEPGRILVDECMYLLTRVIAIKQMASGTKGALVDAGVNLLPTAFYYKHDMASDQEAPRYTEEVDIFGPLCMQIDLLRKNVKIPYLQVGDTITISNVGAYNFSQSMQFIFPRPAILMLGKNGPEVIRQPETYDDLKRLETVPEHLLAAGSANPVH